MKLYYLPQFFTVKPDKCEVLQGGNLLGFFNILVVDLHRFHKILRNSCFANLKLLADLLELGLLLDEHLDLLLRPPVDQKVKLVKDALRVDIMKCTLCVINMPLLAKRKNKQLLL